MAARTQQPISLRAYARRRGVSAEAVSKAIAAGRLSESVTTVGGKPKIVDAELADREWQANTRSSTAAAQAPAPGIPDFNTSRALREAASVRRETALADLAEIELAEKRGEVISVAQARADVIERYTIVKTKILGVPSRLAQQLPHLAAEAVPAVDRMLREVLEELAAGPEPDDGDIAGAE